MKRNNRIFPGISPLNSPFLVSLVEVVSAPLTERNNRNFARGSPIELSFFGLFGQKHRLSITQDGVLIDFHFSDFLYIYIYIFRVFLSNPISIIRIVEYSTISVLEYFEDTLNNVGLPES